MRYGIRVHSQLMDIQVIKKYWCGQIIPHKDLIVNQVFDMLPPIDCPPELTLPLAKELKKYVQETLGYSAEIIKIKPN